MDNQRPVAYATLLTADSYLPGVLTVHASMVVAGCRYPLVVMATPSLSVEARAALKGRGIIVRDVETLRPDDGKHTLDAADVRFGDTWTKLRAFELVEYERVVLIDADMILRRPMDELFDFPLEDGWIAAAHVCACNPRKLQHYPTDWVPENCAHNAVQGPHGAPPSPSAPNAPRPHRQLNSGTVVLQPSLDALGAIAHLIAASPLVPTFAFPDQDVLSHHYAGRWAALPWKYNALKTLRTVHRNVWSDDEVRCVHYIFSDKPWHVPRGRAGEYEEVNGWWWDVYEGLCRDMAESDPEGLALMEKYVARA
ncbi:nucleotide-diphospho-sugar transferase [Epithele typhae]|uniref:nucleotide-diphospho-sugar transferase n=1 Tax=Epithele typhae TaxID=378194 RepID=UPI0020089310|nr:nucleotide-diphospho-sugar transferase [Epithele typhae]KAH9944519.1 nucleotide-diphospho-sugar transferase [Epithele typhae]